MIKNTNDFFRYRKAFFGSVETFKTTGIYKHFSNVFGELIYVDDPSAYFIGVDINGYFYDEIYYPMDISGKIGAIVPKIFMDKCFKKPNLIWKDVAEKGYAVINGFDFDQKDKSLVVNDTYMPFGFNKEFDFHETILHPYYATQMDYDNPENHKDPDYLHRITASVLDHLKAEDYKLHTTAVSYTDLRAHETLS
jgi:hypothetical protein